MGTDNSVELSEPVDFDSPQNTMLRRSLLAAVLRMPSQAVARSASVIIPRIGATFATPHLASMRKGFATIGSDGERILLLPSSPAHILSSHRSPVVPMNTTSNGTLMCVQKL